jgi:hypothetical protein
VFLSIYIFPFIVIYLIEISFLKDNGGYGIIWIIGMTIYSQVYLLIFPVGFNNLFSYYVALAFIKRAVAYK